MADRSNHLDQNLLEPHLQLLLNIIRKPLNITYKIKAPEKAKYLLLWLISRKGESKRVLNQDQLWKAEEEKKST